MKRKIQFITITFIIICGIFLIKVTNSRYLSEANLDGNVDVAVPQIVLDTSSISTSELLLPGDSKTCEFYIRNYEDSKINEVLMTYYINVNKITSEIPLTYKIYEITGTSETELTETTEGFGPIALNYGQAEDKHYKITFTWDENDNNFSYANKEFSFQISVNASQAI